MRRIDARLTPLQTERLIESLSLQSYVSRIEDAAAVFMLDLPNVHVIRSDLKGYVDNPAYGHVVFVSQLSK